MNTNDLIIKAGEATTALSALSDAAINTLLTDTAAALRTHYTDILEANRLDLERMESSNPKYDRLMLTRERIEAIATDMEHVATLPSPLDITYSRTERPNGMTIRKVSEGSGNVACINFQKNHRRAYPPCRYGYLSG